MRQPKAMTNEKGPRRKKRTRAK